MHAADFRFPFALAVLLAAAAPAPRAADLPLTQTLSTSGSTRGTAYAAANKIVSAGDSIFVAWLDHLSNTMIRRYDRAANRWDPAILVGFGTDNHGGPALTIDNEGYLSIVYGPHHGPLKFRRSARPHSVDAWDPEETFTDKATYPSLVCGPDGTLHVTYRSSATDPWRLLYQRRAPGGQWSEPLALVDAVATGYAQFGNSLAVAPDGTLHLAFHVYDQKPAGGKMIGYLRAPDGGLTWQNATGAPMTLPVRPDSDCAIERGAGLDMRTGNVALDPEGRPWITASHLEGSPRTVLIWRHDGRSWKSIDPLPAARKVFPNVELTDGTITFDARGRLYLAATAGDATLQAGNKYWGNPSQEIVLLVSADRGASFDISQISTRDPEKPNWLPSIERPFGPKPLAAPPAVIWTHGGPGIGLKEGPTTDIQFHRSLMHN